MAVRPMRAASAPTGPLGAVLARWAPALERAFLAFVLALAAGAFGFVDNILYATGGDFPTHFSRFTLLSWPAAYAGFALLALRRPDGLTRGLAAAPWVLAFPLAAALSVAWSLAPGETAGAAFRLAVTVLIGVHLGARLDPVATARLVVVVLGVAVGLSCLLHLAGLGFATMSNGFARGLFYHKNTLGNAAVVLLAAATALLCGRPRDPLALGGLAAGLAALPLADSATATVTAGLVLLGAAVLVLRARPLGVALLAGLVLVALALGTGLFLVTGVSPLALLFDALDKEPTLTGRAYLWETALAQLALRPVLGTGYGAFWVAAVDWRTLQVLDLLGQVGHFHNTFLEIGVELGAVGLAAALATLWLYGVTAWRHLRRVVDRRAVWTWLFLVVVVASCMTEIYAFTKHALSTILLVALVVGMRLELAAGRRRR